VKEEEGGRVSGKQEGRVRGMKVKSVRESGGGV
jgi:hypothetical protein